MCSRLHNLVGHRAKAGVIIRNPEKRGGETSSGPCPPGYRSHLWYGGPMFSVASKRILIPVAIEFSSVGSLPVGQHQKAFPVSSVLGPSSYVRFAGRRSKTPLPRGFPSAEVSLITSAISPLLRASPFYFSVHEVALERAPPFDCEYPVPAFRSCFPLSAEPVARQRYY